MEVANKIYENMAEFFEKCHDKGVAFTCENPSRSYLWVNAGHAEVGNEGRCEDSPLPAMHARWQAPQMERVVNQHGFDAEPGAGVRWWTHA